jgi:tetratricopeptide (TPR) repeat protein
MVALRRALVAFVVLYSLPVLADARSEAREHFRKGSRAFDLGAYEEAIQEYGAAYRIIDDPALLYNLGQANRLGGHPAEALHLYKVYLSKKPDAQNRAEVENKIAELQKLVDQENNAKRALPPDQATPAPAPELASPQEQPTATPAPVAASPAQPVDRNAGRTKKIAGIVVGGLGVAMIATGIAFGVMAQSAGDDLTKLDQQMGTFDASKQRDGQTDTVVEGVMLGLGSAALVAGVVTAVLGYRESKRVAVSAAPMLGPNLAGASLKVGF